jgi:phage terminase large subunit
MLIRKIQYSRIVDLLESSDKRIVSLRGGTRSSKTYNTLIWWITKLLETENKVLTIARNTMPALKASAMRDFFEILDSNFGLYNEDDHNKTLNEYHLNNNLVEFIGVNQADRVRGRKRHWLFLNEANENNLESWRQLTFRTTEKIVLDYNPSDAFSWIYDDVETRDDCQLFVTTYKDNPFLEPSLIQEIERLKDADTDYWNIYGLGLIGSGSSRIYTHWREVAESAYPTDKGEKVYGLDFGYNNPSSLVEITMDDNTLFWREMLYQSKLTNADLIEKLKTFPELKDGLIIADSAEPQRIEEIERAGFKIQPAFKLVKDTVDFVKSKPLRIHNESANLLREIKRYSWKTDKNGVLLDEVVKFDDHALDAGRYGSFYFNQPQFEVTDHTRNIFKSAFAN